VQEGLFLCRRELRRMAMAMFIQDLAGLSNFLRRLCSSALARM
jgi:hypothetical protein